MGLLGALGDMAVNKVKDAVSQGVLGAKQDLADMLKRGREHENTFSDRLNKVASNIERYDPVTATALKGVAKFDNLIQIPFRKMNMFLYNKLVPPTTSESTKVEHNKEQTERERINRIRKLIDSKRITVRESVEASLNKKPKRKKAKLSVHE